MRRPSTDSGRESPVSRSIFDVDTHRKKAAELEKETLAADFWSDQEKARKVLQQMSASKTVIDKIESIEAKAADISVFLELADDQNRQEMAEIEKETAELSKIVEDTEFAAMLSGEFDGKNAILSVHAGAGGTDSQDWANMLLRMYMRYLENSNYKSEIADTSPGEEAGIKSATVLVSGPWAYGYLKAERGVHRLVRLSPFDAAHRRHTSFALVEVLPDIEEDANIEVNPDDLKVDTYRSSGAGGQHVNKTDSAIRITHLPTGIIVQCQNERSQHSNRQTAMKILKARLFERMQEEQKKQIAQLKGEHRDIAWGNQIRSYVLHPYSLVKDHRTGLETGNTQAVLDGEIDQFIRSFLQMRP